MAETGILRCCLSSDDGTVSGSNGRAVLATDYEITEGTTYGISAWEGGDCDAYVPQTGRWTQSLGGVTIKPTDADVSGSVYQVRIP